MTFQQGDIFGGTTEIASRLRPDELPRAINDWALCVQILLFHKRPIDYFTIAKDYGITKFQTRIAEILTVYPGLISITEAKVPKRLQRIVTVHKYLIPDKDAAIDIYMEVLNKKGRFNELYQRTKKGIRNEA